MGLQLNLTELVICSAQYSQLVWFSKILPKFLISVIFWFSFNKILDIFRFEI